MNAEELKELRIQKRWFDKMQKATTAQEVRDIQDAMGYKMFMKIKKNYYIFCNLECD